MRVRVYLRACVRTCLRFRRTEVDSAGLDVREAAFLFFRDCASVINDRLPYIYDRGPKYRAEVHIGTLDTKTTTCLSAFVCLVFMLAQDGGRGKPCTWNMADDVCDLQNSRAVWVKCVFLLPLLLCMAHIMDTLNTWYN